MWVGKARKDSLQFSVVGFQLKYKGKMEVKKIGCSFQLSVFSYKMQRERQNIARGKSTTGHYRNNIYQVISLEEFTKHPDPGKIINFVGSKMKLSLVSKCYPNNTNLNITNLTTTKGGKDAVVAVVNFKKLNLGRLSK